MPGDATFDAHEPDVGTRSLTEPARLPVGWGVPPRGSSARLVAMQRTAGNRAVGRLLRMEAERRERGQEPRMRQLRRPPGPTLQRLIDGQIDANSLNAESLATASNKDALDRIVSETDRLTEAIAAHNNHDQAKEAQEARKKLLEVVDIMVGIDAEIEGVLPWLMRIDGQTAADKATYVALAGFKARFFELAQKVNDEVARTLGIKRAGPGGRPDANTKAAIEASVKALGLTGAETKFLSDFAEKQGGTYKEKREALTAIWAKRGGLFTTLAPGKGNPQGLDVEYRTTDRGKLELWDQKTMFSGETGFAGRLEHTHTKGKEIQIGLLLDTTFETRTNYEKAWLRIGAMLLKGEIEPKAVIELHAPNPERLVSDVFVDLNNVSKAKSDANLDANVAWAEEMVGANPVIEHGFAVIAIRRLDKTNLHEVLDHPDASFSRYLNNRDWLPRNEVYNEFPVKGAPNPGKARFVVTEGAATRRVYLSVTHYSGFTVKRKDGTVVSRNAFYRVS